MKIDFEPDKYTDYVITVTPKNKDAEWVYSFDDVKVNIFGPYLSKQTIQTKHQTKVSFVHEVKVLSPDNDDLFDIIEKGVNQLLSNQKVKDGGIPVLVIDTKTAEKALSLDSERFIAAINKLRNLGGGLASETGLNKAASDRLAAILKSIQEGTLAPPKDYYKGTSSTQNKDDKENQ